MNEPMADGSDIDRISLTVKAILLRRLQVASVIHLRAWSVVVRCSVVIGSLVLDDSSYSASDNG